jgi:hypothetical protein
VALGESVLHLWRAEGSEPGQPVLLVQSLSFTQNLLMAPDRKPAEAVAGPICEFIQALQCRGRDAWVLVIADPFAPLSAQALAVSNAIRIVSEAANGANLDVVGLSVGGLAARYALARDEAIGGVSCGKVNTFVTIGTPHQGLNLPVGLQAGLWVAGGNRAEAIMLAPSVQNIVFQWVGATNFAQNPYRFPLDGSIVSTAAAHDAFYAELSVLNGDGYPHRSRNVAVAGTAPAALPHRAGDVVYRVQAAIRTAAGSIELCQENYTARAKDVLPGSRFPRDLLPGSVQLGALSLTLDCQFEPTCLPVASALDLRGAESPFAATFVGQESPGREDALPDGTIRFLMDELAPR